MPNFDPNAMLRGAQLTIVGAHRALLNPHLFKHDHYKQALWAVAAGIIIHVLLEIPILLARGSVWTTALFINMETVTWDEAVIDILGFLQHSVLQLPFFLMNLLKFLSPALDNMFMEALQWVDRTYEKKHESEDPSTLRAMYYPNLQKYTSSLPPVTKSLKKTPWDGISHFCFRYARKSVFGLSIYLVSHVPYVGKFILPVYSFYVFEKAVGPKPAVFIFASGLFLPKRYLITFLQTYFASRSMMRELLEPYFSRIHFNKRQKTAWFLDREGVLFGFGVGFFLLIKIPFLGVLVYGIAEASTAYLITKITDPPPPPSQKEEFVNSQMQWSNKKDFLKMPLEQLDALNVATTLKGANPTMTGLSGKKFL